MLPAERARVLAFLFVNGLVFTCAASACVRMWMRTTTPPTRRQVVVRRLFMALGVLQVACVLYGWLVEPYWLDVTLSRIDTPKLKRGQSIRIAHVSDLHCVERVRLEERLPDAVAEAHPDLIVFSGDALSSKFGLPVLKRLLTRLSGIAPTYVVKGNWDVWYWRDLDLFGGTGVHEVDGNAIELDVRGARLWVGGAAVENNSGMAELLRHVPRDRFTVFLHHYPDEIMTVADAGVDLYCAGHTHGGQVALPFYGALLTLSRFGKKYEAGLYRERDTWLYVNRGLGMEGGASPPVRFCARPELTLIDIVGTAP